MVIALFVLSLIIMMFLILRICGLLPWASTAFVRAVIVSVCLTVYAYGYDYVAQRIFGFENDFIGAGMLYLFAIGFVALFFVSLPSATRKTKSGKADKRFKQRYKPQSEDDLHLTAFSLSMAISLFVVLYLARKIVGFI
ncbi:hypothetical protein [Moraxella sp. RCAD0137]|uniref:hypothetical protein n=1 Tax=Moraxella sp. RCAD0137 TaxID=1775913 RepID=UPI000C9EF001|nr:hypothetical protein [Moraxella sp. RCAD0137]PNP98509.1 hypothetical protein AZ602_02505 [Moraxella sp. RCAD0137]